MTNLTIYTVSFWFFGWHYDAATGLYSRSDAGVPIVDAIDGEPLTRRSLVVQIVAQTEVFGDPDPGGFSRREQHLVGSGVGTLYVDGRAIDLRWSRASADDPTTWTFADSGEPLVLPPGEVYWGIIPDTGSIIEE